MKVKFLTYLGLAVALYGCTLEEAKAPKDQHLVVYTDHYCPEDSSIVNDFEEFTNIQVRVVYLSPKDIIGKIQKNKYNAGMDVLLLSTDSIREILHERKYLQPLTNGRIFRKLGRQFHTKHAEWLSVCHNPLVLSVKIDSSATCASIQWKKIYQDSTGVKYHSDKSAYTPINKLKNHSKFKQLFKEKSNPYAAVELWNLSEMVAYSNAHSSFASSHCNHFAVENQKYYTTVTSISLYRNARNKAAAVLFLEHYAKFAYQIASYRNQLSTFNGVRTNYLVEQLNIK
jgi:ABC-type Fe3+ transport system substrate-binding protein